MPVGNFKKEKERKKLLFFFIWVTKLEFFFLSSYSLFAKNEKLQSWGEYNSFLFVYYSVSIVLAE